MKRGLIFIFVLFLLGGCADKVLTPSGGDSDIYTIESLLVTTDVGTYYLVYNYDFYSALQTYSTGISLEGHQIQILDFVMSYTGDYHVVISYPDTNSVLLEGDVAGRGILATLGTNSFTYTSNNTLAIKISDSETEEVYFEAQW